MLGQVTLFRPCLDGTKAAATTNQVEESSEYCTVQLAVENAEAAYTFA
jgi:hypothetical protein